MKIGMQLRHNIEERNVDDIKNYFRPESFIDYCKACQYYDKIWTCPSYDFETAKLLEGFQYIYVIGSTLKFNELEGSLKALIETEKAEYAANEIYLAARMVIDGKLTGIGDRDKSVSVLLAGRCLACSRCTREKQLPCIYPEKAHFSLESLGFDVSSICEDILGDKLLWTQKGLPEYLTLVSAILSHRKLNIQDIYNSLI